MPIRGSCIQNHVVNLNDPQGAIYSPALFGWSNYPHLSNCTWKITVEPGKVSLQLTNHNPVTLFCFNLILKGIIYLQAVNLTFSLFRISGYECPDDYIRVFDGPEHGGQQLAR